MKKLLVALLLLSSLAFADFQMKGLSVSVKLNENGTASVTESMDFVVFGQYSMQLYESGFNNNTLTGWQQITNISDIRTHISAKYADIKPILIRPQPLDKSLSAQDVWYGQLIMSYDAAPYYERDGSPVNGTGVVLMDSYKPRVTRYTLNEKVFSFERTNSGDIKLSDTTTLAIEPPQNALLFYVNPITRNMHNSTFPTQSVPLSWSGLTLVQFSVVYEVEQSLDREVLSFFSGLQNNVLSSLVSAEGFAAMALIIILVASYFYLRISRR